MIELALTDGAIESIRAAVTFAILAGTIYGFVSEKIPPDIVSVLSILALILTRILTPAEAFSGLSHPATISLAAVLVLSFALERTGMLTILARRVLSPLGRSEWLLTAVVMLVIGGLSAFINNTAAVAIFIPVVMETCRRSAINPGRILMPMSHAATFGGLCTLVGTSTNIVANEFARAQGLPGFSMFEPGRIGLPLALAGAAYILFVGRWFLPKERVETSDLDLEGAFVSEIIVGAESTWAGKPVDVKALARDRDIELVGLTRGKVPVALRSDEKFAAGDALHVRGPLEEVLKLAKEPGLSLHRPEGQAAGEPTRERLAEVAVLSTSGLIGRTLKETGFAGRFDAVVLAVKRRGRVEARPSETPLQAGDVLLVEGTKGALQRLASTIGFLAIRTPSHPEPLSKRTRMIALSTLAAVILFISLGWLPTATAALSGCAVLVLTRCLRPKDAYQAIDLGLVLMLSGTLALGVALEKTGITAGLATLIAMVTGISGPMPVMVCFFVIAVLTSEFMSNSGTVALLGPVAISVSQQMDVNPMTMIAAVCFGASAAFAMPLGYQTNLMIFGPGGYRVRDFVRMGIPLNVLFAVLACWLIPQVWPLHLR